MTAYQKAAAEAEVKGVAATKASLQMPSGECRTWEEHKAVSQAHEAAATSHRQAANIATPLNRITHQQKAEIYDARARAEMRSV